MFRKFAVPTAAFAAIVLAAAVAVHAQQAGMGSGSGSGSMIGAGSGSGIMTMKKGMMQGGDCPMMGQMMKSGDMAAHADARIGALKTALAITPAQQGAWDTYAAALKKQMAGMHAAHQAMMSGSDAKSPIERLDGHVAMMEGRIAALKEAKPALAALYAVLGDDQKRKASEAISGGRCGMN